MPFFGVTQYLDDRELKTSARFDGADAGGFVSETEIDATWLDLEAGMSVKTRSGAMLTASAVAQLSETAQSYVGTISVNVPF